MSYKLQLLMISEPITRCRLTEGRRKTWACGLSASEEESERKWRKRQRRSESRTVLPRPSSQPHTVNHALSAQQDGHLVNLSPPRKPCLQHNQLTPWLQIRGFKTAKLLRANKPCHSLMFPGNGTYTVFRRTYCAISHLLLVPRETVHEFHKTAAAGVEVS